MFGPAVQAAQEAIQQATRPDWPAVGMATVAAMGSWLAIIYGRKKNGGKPGTSDTCRKHGEDIASLKEFKGNTESSLERIEGKLDRLLMK